MSKWEIVQQDDLDRQTERLQVPGGWLYLVLEMNIAGSTIGQVMTFVPEPPSTPRTEEPAA